MAVSQQRPGAVSSATQKSKRVSLLVEELSSEDLASILNAKTPEEAKKYNDEYKRK